MRLDPDLVQSVVGYPLELVVKLVRVGDGDRRRTLNDVTAAVWPVMPQMFDAVISLDDDLKEAKDE
jgi:hypothetical protein